jgi:predicted glutamine amidotransferase
MCGIGGVRKYGSKPISEDVIRGLLIGLETRGNDASGIAMQNIAGEVFVYKHDTAAWNFVVSDGYSAFLNEHLDDEITQVIVHTRAATKGTCRINNNNHPLHHGKAAVIHNGIVHNDDELFRTLSLDRHAETDTDIFRAIIDRYGFSDEAMNHLNKVRGSAAIAVLHPEHPGKMLLGRSGNPIVLASNEDFLIFASEKNVLHSASKPWVKRFGIDFQVQTPDMAYSVFPDNTIWMLGEEGREAYTKFATIMGTYREPVRRTYENWKDRQEKDADTASDGPYVSTSTTTLTAPAKKVRAVIECPKCKKKMGMSPEMQNMDLSDLSCPKDRGGCGESLSLANVN